MLPKDAKNLLERYNAGEATEPEKALVETWYLQYKHSNVDIPDKQLEDDQLESLNNLLIQIQQGGRKAMLWPLLSAAASLLIFFFVALYFYKSNKPPVYHVVHNKRVIHEITPGGNKAILTLANGSKIVLTQAQNGRIASQGDIVINKTRQGQITYSGLKDAPSSQNNLYNTATTPHGGQFMLILSDGTNVWLNAASSIKYPVAFNGNERRVEITGEVYFEVAHNAQKPFRVVSKGQVVEVLGTHFNINAYSDEEATKTTLLQGSVKITSGKVSSTIKPGEQAQFKRGNINVIDADVEEVVAWKNGFFYFKDADIKAVMRQMSRWYDAEVTYEGNIPERKFSGEISRNINASQLLDILSFKKIHFRIEGKKIIVMP